MAKLITIIQLFPYCYVFARPSLSGAERTQTRRPCTEALEQSLSLECSHSSDVQEGINRSLTAQTSSHKLLPPQPGSNTETRMQVPTSTREEHLQSTGPVVHSGPGRKRPGGYEWMLPARATLPRTLTSSQGGTGNHKASRSVENLVSEKSNYSRQPIPTFSVTTTKANPSLNDDSEEDYEEMRSAKRRSAYSPRHQ